MEYQKEKRVEKHYQDSEGPQLNCQSEDEDKENLFKEIYTNIALFKKLVYEAKKESKYYSGV